MDASFFYKTDGTYDWVNPRNEKFFTLEELQEYVGGYIEIVRLNNESVMVINEEGKTNGLPINPIATQMYQACTGINDVIVGNALECLNRYIN